MGQTEGAGKCALCGKSGEQRCSACHLVVYCSREHQKTDWKHHRDVCRTCEVHSSEELGRHLVAVRDLQPGEGVLSETPLVFAPKSLQNPEAAMPCVGCYKPVPTEVGERCPKCGWPVCSGYCPGLKDPLHHGLECTILSLRSGCAVNDMADYYRHDALLALRCLLLQQRAPKKWKKLIDMQSHMESRTPDTEIYQETDEFIVKYLMSNFISLLKSLEKEMSKAIIPDVSEELIHQICGIIDTNALEIRLNNGAELLALYTNTCTMEHNCVPNTKHIFNLNGKVEEDIYKISVRVVLPVKKGDHVTTMYSHALWGTQARRQHLKETKYFACKCQRCRDPTELGTCFSAMKCFGDGINPCDGMHLPEDPLDEETEWACNKCTAKVKNDQVNYLVAKMGEEVDNVQMTNPCVSVLENLMEKLSMFLHPNHYHLYSVKHSLVQLYGHQQGYQLAQLTDELIRKKINMCRDLISVTKILDPGNARLSLYTGVLQHELHLALVMVIKKAKKDGKVNSESGLMSTLNEAKDAIDQALTALEDEQVETAGNKLYAVVKETSRCFTQWCDEIKDLS